MKRYIKQITGVFALSSLALLNSCSLDEKNPGGFTFDTVTMTEDGYQAILNQIYFGAERVLYGTDGYMQLTEADTDLWTTKANDGNSNTQYFWFFGGASANTTYTNTIWNAIYDGIGSCNTAIAYAANPPISEAKRNNSIAQARFMRAVYYFNAVEQFGGVVKVTDLGVPNYAPERTDPLTIYKEVIIPDLEFATQYLDKGTDATCTTPTKKAALGFLAKACLQTYEYGSTEFLQKGMDAAKALITDCENGGSQYGAYMYSNFEDVFKQDNSWENKEALWKHRWYSGSDSMAHPTVRRSVTAMMRCSSLPSTISLRVRTIHRRARHGKADRQAASCLPGICSTCLCRKTAHLTRVSTNPLSQSGTATVTTHGQTVTQRLMARTLLS